jgi:hypothetical protein
MLYGCRRAGPLMAIQNYSRTERKPKLKKTLCKLRKGDNEGIMIKWEKGENPTH